MSKILSTKIGLKIGITDAETRLEKLLKTEHPEVIMQFTKITAVI